MSAWQLRSAARSELERRLQHGAAVLHVAAVENLVERVAHVARADVGQKSEPAAIDAQHRHAVRGGQPRGVQHRAVAADRDDQVRLARQRRFRTALDAESRRSRRRWRSSASTRRPRACRWAAQDLHRLDDARVAIVADEGDAFELLWSRAWSRVCSTAGCRSCATRN